MNLKDTKNECETNPPVSSEMTAEELETYRLHRRFDRMGRLVGDEAMKTLMNSHVMIIGLGGVGSWAAESIARSGVGKISVVDFDEICITNTNRQLHALSGLVGKKKAEVLGERLQKINPQAEVVVHAKFYNAANSESILGSNPEEYPDFIIDAIDNITAKCHLIHRCRELKIGLVVSTGSAGKMNPLQIEAGDLSETEKDPLARSIRKILREKYGFPEKGRFGIPAVFSREEVRDPFELHYDGGKGFKCVCPQGQNNLHSCEHRNIILGNTSFVTGAYGLACASIAVRTLLNEGPFVGN